MSASEVLCLYLAAGELVCSRSVGSVPAFVGPVVAVLRNWNQRPYLHVRGLNNTVWHRDPEDIVWSCPVLATAAQELAA